MRIRNFTLLIVALAIAGAIWTPAAGAAVTSAFSGPNLYLTSDQAADSISLACVGGYAKNGSTPYMYCADVQAVYVQGGGGNDIIDFSAVDAQSFPNLHTVKIDSGDGTDTVTGSGLADDIDAASSANVNAGDGDDQITGGGTVDSGAGDDVLRNTYGPIDAGPGDDLVQNPLQSGPITGGDGFDTIEWDTRSIPIAYSFSLSDSTIQYTQLNNTTSLPATSFEHARLLFGPEGQSLDASDYHGQLEVDGGDGDDRLVGGPGDDVIRGGKGHDFLSGAGGSDFVQGDSGNDTLILRDGESDHAGCGDGSDSAILDALDSFSDCEFVTDTTASKLKISKATLRKGELRFSAGCPAGESECSTTATLSVTARRGRKQVTHKLGKIKIYVAGGQTTKLKKKLSNSKLRSLRGLRKAKLTLTMTVKDWYSNVVKQTQSVSLKL